MSVAITPLPGCEPQGGMAGLIQCSENVNAATAFVQAILIDLINNDPTTAEAMIGAINKAGSNVPSNGVTNGMPATSPQVGQYVQFSGTLDYTSTVASALLSLGVLPAGDWDCWLWATFTAVLQGAAVSLSPLPAGFAANPTMGVIYGATPPNATIFSMQVEALTSGDSLIVANTQAAATSGASGTMTVYFAARRRR